MTNVIAYRVNYPCPTNYNPADHYVHTLAVIPGQENECKAKCNVSSFENDFDACTVFLSII